MLTMRVPGGERSGRVSLSIAKSYVPAGREHGPAAVMSPRPDDRGKAGDRPHGHAAAVMALHAVIEADQRRLLAAPGGGPRSRSSRRRPR